MDEEATKTHTEPKAEPAAAEPKMGVQSAPTNVIKIHEVDSNRAFAILAYIGPLIIIPLLIAKHDPFVRFHIKQGLLIFIGEIATWLIAGMLFPSFSLIRIFNIFLFVLAIVGIIRAATGEMKELPLIGHLAKKFTF